MGCLSGATRRGVAFGPRTHSSCIFRAITLINHTQYTSTCFACSYAPKIKSSEEKRLSPSSSVATLEAAILQSLRPACFKLADSELNHPPETYCQHVLRLLSYYALTLLTKRATCIAFLAYRNATLTVRAMQQQGVAILLWTQIAAGLNYTSFHHPVCI